MEKTIGQIVDQYGLYMILFLLLVMLAMLLFERLILRPAWEESDRDASAVLPNLDAAVAGFRQLTDGKVKS